ncbi:MAG TPA: YtxH domain-containing protein [Chthonomonadales bacterium]|nr:YtxH domain-containing protein [Chthonomonadales bacterium]
MLRFTVGLLIGAFLGATFAMLLAPQPGKEVRRSLLHRAHVVQQRVRDLRSRANANETIEEDLSADGTQP